MSREFIKTPEASGLALAYAATIKSGDWLYDRTEQLLAVERDLWAYLEKWQRARARRSER